MIALPFLRTATRAACAVIVSSGIAVGGADPAGAWVWPLQPVPALVRGFEPPSSPYAPGHRGVDLAGSPGQQVIAIGAGRVTFAGSVAGHGVVVVDHGRLDSTYQPVTPLVSMGATVLTGQVLGVLQLIDSHCAPQACLHLGVRRGDSYLDPMELLPPRPVRLKPLAGLGAGPGDRLDEWPDAAPAQPRPTGQEWWRSPGGS